MKIKVLVDNNTFIDHYYLGEPALSFLLEEEGRFILFDTGYSDVLLRNAEKMNIDLGKIDTIIFSHGHNDHTAGLQNLLFLKQDIDIYCHPDCAERKVHNGLEIGCPYDFNTLPDNFHVHFTKERFNITDKLVYMGEIERSVQPLRKLEDDPLFDDTALYYVNHNRLSIITGCSHSGINNIIAQAMKETGISDIDTVIGGFHLLDDKKVTDEVVDYFDSLSVEKLYPCHCTGLQARIALSRNNNVYETGVSLEIEV